MLSRSDTQLAKRLIEYRAVIAAGQSNAYPAYPYGDRRKRPISWVSAKSFESLERAGGLSRDAFGFKIADSLAQALSPSPDAAAQHRRLEERDIYVPSGVRRKVSVNSALSALDRLSRRKDRAGELLISKAQYEAGQRFARDYHLAGYESVSTQNYMSAGADKTRYNGQADKAQRCIDARARIRRAETALGEGLTRPIIALCCLDSAIEQVERSEKWAQGSGLTIVKLGLTRLVSFYGTTSGGKDRSGAI